MTTETSLKDLREPERPGPKMVLAYVVYQALALVTLPLVFLFILYRARREPGYRRRFAQRLGFGPVAPDPAVWIFAASLGEARAASPVAARLAAEGRHVMLTTNTPAGLAEAARIAETAPNRISARYAPLDFFAFVLLFLLRNRPLAGMVMESELWPGYLLLPRWLGIPMLHVNGNLSDEAVDRDLSRWTGGLRLSFLRLYHAILTRSDRYKSRYVRAGVEASRVFPVGELKFDQAVDPAHLRKAKTARAGWAPGAPVVMISSSVEDEEDALLDMIERLLAHPAAPKIVWAPRSPGRFDAVSDKAAARAITARRSEVLDADLNGCPPVEARALIGDSIGEMNYYYGLSDLVFVGATLVPLGGHNIVEPLVLERPVITGPSVYAILYPALEAEEAGALKIAESAEDATETAIAFLSNPEALLQARRAAASFAAAHFGAADRSLALINPLIDARARRFHPPGRTGSRRT